MPGGSGSGMPGGEYHSGCVCVHMPSDGYPTGSGGTGSGSGATPLPPTGGNGTATTAPGPDDDVVIRVKSFIDSGTCERVSSSASCGNSAESYYKEFTYNS